MSGGEFIKAQVDVSHPVYQKYKATEKGTLNNKLVIFSELQRNKPEQEHTLPGTGSLYLVQDHSSCRSLYLAQAALPDTLSIFTKIKQTRTNVN